MKKLVLSVTAMAVAASGFSASAKSFKRGVSENSFSLVEEMTPLEPGCSWHYSWGNTPRATVADFMSEDTWEFIPMCWNGNYNADAIREYCKAHPETKYLLGFNEPNFTAQANMTPEVAAAAWPAVKALADELGLELVGPAINYSPNPPYQDPFKWYAEFVALVGTDAFDYIAIHDYAGGSGNMSDMAQRFYDAYGKKIWVTEFCYWPGEGNGAAVTAEDQVQSMVTALTYLENSDIIYRYAWFKAKGSVTNSPCYGLMIPKNGEGERELSEAGRVYVNMSTFDKEKYYGMDEIVPAKDYVMAQSLSLATSNDPQNTGVIEISRFNSGASADYLFDVPEAKEYTLTLHVSGQGEPARFDPTIGIYSVDAEGEEELAVLSEPVKFALSGSDNSYRTVEFKMNLAAGKQRIRVKDTNPYQPSGIRISCLSFGSELKDVDAPGSVHGLSAGFGKVACSVADGMIRFTGAEVARAAVYDLNGRVVADAAVSGNALDLGGVAHGIYVVRAYAADGTMSVMKIVK